MNGTINKQAKERRKADPDTEYSKSMGGGGGHAKSLLIVLKLKTPSGR